MKQIITAAGKKFYTIVVGKLNVPKLANFSEIDLFVLIAGPENTLMDSRDYFKPIVTPFEVEIALVKYVYEYPL
jgi:diphthamide biosynthesis protein 2